MWSLARAPRPRTLAGQFLALQVVLLLLVVAVTSVVSFRQSDADFRDARGARLRASAENLSSTPAVQVGMDEPSQWLALTAYAQQRQDDTGASAVHLTDPDGRVVVSTDPGGVGEQVELGPGVTSRRAWNGDLDDGDERAIAAQVPIIGVQEDIDAGELVGVVVVTERYPSITERLRQTVPDMLSFLLVGLALGLAGAWLLARLIKRRTRGLEPAEIAELADQREALLTSLREGVIAVNEAGTVTVLSESARELLEVPPGSQGRCSRSSTSPCGCSSCCSVARRSATLSPWWPGGCWCSTATTSSRTDDRPGPSPRCATAPSCSRCRASSAHGRA